MTTSVIRDTSRLAKLARPRLQGLLPRPRLFELLDRRRERPVVWVAGPPGAGKTSLVASYLQARRLPSLWYDLDAGEADPATFFYYLRLAASRFAPSASQKLPLLTPEFAGDLPGFARRFFQAFYVALPDPAIVVLDNYQEVPSESPFHIVVEQALSLVPDGITYLRSAASGLQRSIPVMSPIESSAKSTLRSFALRFEETVGIASGRHKLDAISLRDLHAHADGWAAGTILMLESLRRGGVSSVTKPETMGTLFDYFAGQVFDDLSPSARDLLMRTSFLPYVGADMAVELGANVDSRKVLDSLYRRNLFVDRRTGNEVTYHYHALFSGVPERAGAPAAADAGIPFSAAARCRRVHCARRK